MLSYFCEDRATAFCKVINDSAENYRSLDYIIILFFLSWLTYSTVNYLNKLRSMDIRNHTTVDLLNLALGKAGWLYCNWNYRLFCLCRVCIHRFVLF